MRPILGSFTTSWAPPARPVQLKLMYDAGMSATYTASIYTWKAVANTMVYTGYAVAALAYELFWRREGLGPAVAGAGALIALYVFLCGLALFTAVRPEPIQRLIRRILTFLARHWKVMAREGMVDKGMEKVDEFWRTAPRPQGQPPDAGGPVRGHVCGADGPVCHSLLPLPGAGSDRGLFLGAGAGPVPGAGALPHHHAPQATPGGAEGSFYLFMGPLFGRHLAVGLVLWRFAAFLEVLLLGGAWSVLRFAQRSAAGHGT